jgi:hypothetical protein
MGAFTSTNTCLAILDFQDDVVDPKRYFSSLRSARMVEAGDILASHASRPQSLARQERGGYD